MSRSDQLRRQHQQLAQDISAITPRLRHESVTAEAAAIRMELAGLAGTLNVHLAMEDKTLYPAMLASSDAKTRATAASFQKDMGGLATAFRTYMASWPNPEALTARPAEFCTQTKAVFDALAKRVQQEESTLYPLADAM